MIEHDNTVRIVGGIYEKISYRKQSGILIFLAGTGA
jgi:predicted S18 family serine protease